MKRTFDIPPILIDACQARLQECGTAAAKAGFDLEQIHGIRQVFALSTYVASSCARHPEIFKKLIASGELDKACRPDDYALKLQKLLTNADEASLYTTLRRFRQREMIRIAWRDLMGLANLAETMSDLSSLADACLETTLALLHRQHCLKYGTPRGADGTTQQLVVIGMGKLGARELNFSSDIDLILAYPETGETTGASNSVSNETFFTRLGRSLIQAVGTVTPDGFVFRVDLRLRPYGENGPMVMSFENMETYYQMQGREWERYAWIKARVVAGDRDAGRRLLQSLNPFVYRRYLDFGAFESLRDMKQMIAQEVKRKEMKDNVKLGPGGIREIEFFGQIFQLIRGGVAPELQKRSIQAILEILARENHIPREVCDQLQQAYVFLRCTENRLQEYADQQTHQLPTAPTDRLRLAVSMGFSEWSAFKLRLDQHMQQVHLHFSSLLKARDTDSSNLPKHRLESDLKAVWQQLSDEKQSQKVLKSAGFDDPATVLSLLDDLRNDVETRQLSIDGRERLERLLPKVLEEVGQAELPSRNMARVVTLLKTIQRRTCYLSLLLENPAALSHLVRLIKASSWIASYLKRHPVILDELLDPRTLYAPPEKHDLKKELRQRIHRLPAGDLEYQMEELRIFKQVKTLRVAAADVTGVLPLMKVSDYLTYIAEAVIDEVLKLSWNHLVEKHGCPTCMLDGQALEMGFAVIAYGKLGGIELGYDSDLDLVFLHSGTDAQTTGGLKPVDTPQFFARLGQRFIHILTAHTSAGMLYETDMRLRPSGSAGILVSHIDSFGDYQLNDAWTWEHQAIVRARVISGNKRLAQHFDQIRKSVLSRPRPKAELQTEISDMRERMRKEHLNPAAQVFDLKQGLGAMVDIEFLVQYLVLLKACEFEELTQWTDNVRLLQTLAETGVMDDVTANFLKKAYLAYRSLAHKLSLQEKPAVVPADKLVSLRKRVQDIWDSFLLP